MKDAWTKEDFAEYERQLKMIGAHYPSLPESVQEKWAAVIVNNQKGNL